MKDLFPLVPLSLMGRGERNRRTTLLGQLVAGVALALLAAACGASVSPTPASASLTPATLTPGPPPRVESTRLLALLTGQLAMVKGCLRLEVSQGPESLLLIWPVDITATVSGETVQVTDLLENKQATWHVGDIVPIGGGHISSVRAGLRHIGPADCPGPYYIVSGVYPSASPTPVSAAAATATRSPATVAPVLSATVVIPSAVPVQIVTTRAGPSSEYEVLGELQPGQTYPVIGQQGEWWEVEAPNGQPVWVVKSLMTFSGDAALVPLVAAPATPTVPPGVTEIAQDGIVTFTSTTLGLQFSYQPRQGDMRVRTQVQGNRVYVYDADGVIDDGQYVQVFHKAPGDTLAQAIRQQILAGYDPHDCALAALNQVDDSGAPRPPSVTYAVIMPNVPPTVSVLDDIVATEMAQATKCPPVYTQAGGSAYFMEDTRHPDRFFFFKIGQYWIYSASPGPFQYGPPWQDTLQVLDGQPAPAATAGALAERHQTLASGLSFDEYALQGPPDLDPLNFQPVQWTRAAIEARHQADGGASAYLNSYVDDQGHYSLPAQWNGQTLVARELLNGSPLHVNLVMRRPLWILVQVRQGARTIFAIPTGDPSPIESLRLLLAYGAHWVLEVAHVSNVYQPPANEIASLVTGQIVQDGVLLNTRYGYAEAFGLQLLRGKLFYFFRKDGQVGVSYGGRDTLLGYDAVSHYGCCSGAEMNPRPRADMVSFFAQQGGVWFYVEIGAY